jgi:hypothetical protein
MGPIPPSGYGVVYASQSAAQGGFLSVTARCPAGTLAAGGGYVAFASGVPTPATDLLVQRAVSLPDLSGYRVDANRPGAWSLQVDALCVNAIAL